MVLCRSGVGDGGSGWASICERGAGRLMDEAYELELAQGLPLASRVRAQLLGNGRFWEYRTVELASKMELFHKEVPALPEECCIQLLLHGIKDKQIYQEEVRSPTYQMNLGTYNLGGVIAYPKVRSHNSQQNDDFDKFKEELAHTQEAEMPWQLSERQCKLTMEENEIYTEAGGQKVPKLRIRKASKD